MTAPTLIDPHNLYTRARKMIAANSDLSDADRAFFHAALDVARHAPVTRPHRPQHVFFSITGQPTKRNKMRAMEYLREKGDDAQIIDHTPAGMLLEAMSDRLFKADYDAAYAVWHVASARYAAEAEGDVHVEWADVKEHSTSEQIEAPILLANPAVQSINGTEKKAAMTGLLVHYPDRRKGMGLRFEMYRQNEPVNDNRVDLYPATLGRVMRDYPDVMEAANKMADDFGVERPAHYAARRPQRTRRPGLRL